jgi:hypothetical protein
MTTLVAQEAAWRPVLRLPPPAPAPVRGASTVVGATLDRPVPLARASGSDPDYAERTERPPASRPAADNVTRLPQAGEVIAVSAPAAAPGSTPPGTIAVPGSEPTPDREETGEQFASDRLGSSSAGLALAPTLTVPASKSPLGPLGDAGAGAPGTLSEVPGARSWQRTYNPEPPQLPFPDGVGAPMQDRPPSTRWYLEGEYLLWWARRDKVPPLFTTSEPSDSGFLDRPTTVVLFDGPLERDPRSGARITGGYWLDDDHTKAIEVSGFILGERSARAMFNSGQFPVLARPFQIAQNGAESAELIGFPGVFSGKADIEAPSRLWGLEANLRCPLCSCAACGQQPIQLLAGFRYLNLKETLTITENVLGANVPAAGPLQNSTDAVFDSFSTHNQFYGGQVGAEKRWQWGPFNIDLKGKVALGVTNQEIDINGGQTVTNLGTGATTTAVGGLLALPGANIGHFTKDRFAVVPEVGLTFGYQITSHIRASVGYDFLYWSSVVRPGDQIDRTLDPTKIPNFTPLPPGVTGPASPVRPAVPFRDTDFWAQGLTVGLELTW